MKTTAVIFDAPLSAAFVEEELAEPGPGEVTVEAILTQISTGTEMICYRGVADEGTHWAPFMHYPRHNGYCMLGRVTKVGEGVEEVTVGDRVCATAAHVSHYNVTMKQLWAAPVPDGVSDEDAVWAILGVITQTGVRMAEHVMGDRAVIIGLGPLGQLVTQYLRAMGLREVMVIDRSGGRVQVALEHGANAGFAGDIADAKAFVEELTAGELADVVYDVTGHPAVLPQALPLARDHGTLLMLGDCPVPSQQCLTYDVVSRQVRIVGTRSSWLPDAHRRWTPQRQTDLLFSYLQRGDMRLADLISHRFTPQQGAEAYDLLYNSREETLGVVFDWTQEESGG
jgi:2-desacetyl-2-hydroxyethyl bacteriochlorophyllide A dehydrogenase